MSQTYITVCGIKRSGSTWMANAIRIICEEAGLKVWMGEHRPDMIHHPNAVISEREWPEYDVVINKIHPFIKEVADRSDYVFSSYRDLQEVVSSFIRFKPDYERQMGSYIYDWCFWYYQWKPYVDWEMQYSSLTSGDDRRRGIIRTIAATLIRRHPEISHTNPFDIEEKLREIKPPTDKDYDPETLMFRNHITSV